MNTPKVIENVVNQNLCIGCGVCVASCDSNTLQMKWNEEGFLVPQKINDCNNDTNCIKVCPFNPSPEKDIATEREIAKKTLEDTPLFNKKIGHYYQLYAGFSEHFRLQSSSGGLGSYISKKLLEENIVKHIFSVSTSDISGEYYQYNVISNVSDIQKNAKTRYFPVSMSTVLSEIQKYEGKVAVVGIGCFIKAIRLAQIQQPYLKEKIPFLIGIICGGLKSKFFTEYLASKLEFDNQEFYNPQYREKNTESSASDYSFSCKNYTGELKSLQMKSVGDLWGTGLFKANACDFCEDVTTELADISLGDAWLEPFHSDGRGTNVIVSRSAIAEKLLQKGIDSGELFLEKLELVNFLSSQQGSFNHRHLGLSTRIALAKKNNQKIPPKNFGNLKNTLAFKKVQKHRMLVRQQSLIVWKKNRNAKQFDEEMRAFLEPLASATKKYHQQRRFFNFLKKVRSKIFTLLNKN